MEQKEQIIYKKRILTSENYHNEWNHILFEAEKIMENQLVEISNILEKINHLKNGDIVIDAFTQFKNAPLHSLGRIELRTLSLALINKIDIVFGQPVRINIDYRFSPFFVFEEQIGYITESPSH